MCTFLLDFIFIFICVRLFPSFDVGDVDILIINYFAVISGHQSRKVFYVAARGRMVNATRKLSLFFLFFFFNLYLRFPIRPWALADERGGRKKRRGLCSGSRFSIHLNASHFFLLVQINKAITMIVRYVLLLIESSS